VSEWKTCSVEEISEKVCVGFVGTCAKYYCDEGPDSVPMIRTTDLREDGLATGALLYISKEFHEANKKSQLVYGDILVARHGDNGKAVMYKLKEAANCLNVIIIRPDHELVDHFFLLYLLNNPSTRAEIKSMSSGSVQDVINTKQIANLPILLPPLPEQKAIASVLSSLDDKIDLLHRQNKTLEAMAETLFRQWFVEEADEGWEEGTIYNFFDVIYGFPFKSSLFNEEQRGLPLIRIRDLKDGHSNIYTDEECDPKYILARGDLVVGMDGEFRIYIWSGDRSVLNQRACKFVPKYEYISKLFVFNLMKEHLHFFENTKGGTTVIHLGKADLDSITVKAPPKELMSQYKERVEDSFKKMINNYSQIRTLKKLRDTLLPKLISGEVRVEV
jgi:type I restriction enzyme S subunit